jgi:adenylate kinase family enzyme
LGKEMKRNILIFGTGRVGKTTLAKKLNEELNYSVIGTDDIIIIWLINYI